MFDVRRTVPARCVLVRLSFVLVFVGAAPRVATGATIPAASCTQTDVQAAIDGAADGDTVSVPAGACSWSGLRINNEHITLQGVGTGCDETLTPSGHDPSRCTGTATNITSGDGGAIAVTDDTQPFRITGFRFNKDTYNGSHTITIGKNNAYLSHENAVGWRVDHNYFNGTSGHLSINGARNFGLADHNLYYVPGGAQIFLFWGRGSDEQEGTSDLARLSGQDAHSDPLALGTEHAFYVEDSEFFTNVWQGSQNVIDGTAGQRVVFRHNVVRGPMIKTTVRAPVARGARTSGKSTRTRSIPGAGTGVAGINGRAFVCAAVPVSPSTTASTAPGTQALARSSSITSARRLTWPRIAAHP